MRSAQVMHPIDLPGPKYSHAIYTSYLTGQLPTNYQGHPIKGDHLVKSMKRSPSIGPLTYIGPKWSFLAISGKEADYKQYFDHIDIQEEPLDQPHDRAYRFFFKDTASRHKFKQTLESIKAEDGSLFTHSAIFDHINHGVYRAEPVNTRFLDTLAKRIADDLNTVKEWIDKNPDYLLILSSDHGCDDVSNGYVLHGYSTNGNEGYIMFYNPALTKHQSRIDVVDVAPTIAKYLHKVDIPADNIGLAQTVFPEVGPDGKSTSEQKIKAIQYRGNVLRQNIAQLCDTVRRRGMIGACSVQHVNNIMQLEFDKSDPKKAAEQLKDVEKYASSLKSKLYNMVNKPWFWVVFYASFSAVVIAILIAMHLLPLVRDLIWSRFSISSLKVLFLIPLYFGVFVNLLLCWDTWKNIFRSGAPFIVWQAALSACLLYFFIAFILTKYFGSSNGSRSIWQSSFAENNGGDEDELLPTTRSPTVIVEGLNGDRKSSYMMDSLLGPIMRSGIHRIFYNICIDWVYYSLHELFSKQWKRGAQHSKVSIIPYMLLFVFVMQVLEIRWTEFIISPLRLIGNLMKGILCRHSSSSGLGGNDDSYVPIGHESLSRESTKSSFGLGICRNLGHFIVSCIMLILLVLFELTSSNRNDSQEIKDALQKYYVLFNFHILYFAFMVIAVLYMVYCFLLAPGRSSSQRRSHSLKAVIPVTIYAFALMRDTPHARFLTLMFNFQYLHLLGPFLASLSELSASAFSHIMSTSNRIHNKQKMYLNLLQQAGVLYVINHFFFWFVTAREEKFNIDAHPFAGAVGMLSHQAHPSFNAFQMAFEKWHCLALFAVYVHCALVGSFVTHVNMGDTENQQQKTEEELKKKRRKDSSDKPLPAQIAQGYQHISNLFSSMLTLMLFNAHWFLQLLLCYISMNHGFQESVMYLTVIGAMNGLLQLLHIFDWWKQSNIMRIIFRKQLSRSPGGRLPMTSQKSK